MNITMSLLFIVFNFSCKGKHMQFLGGLNYYYASNPENKKLHRKDWITKLKSKEEMGMFCYLGQTKFCSAEVQVVFWYIYLGGTKQLSLIFPQFNFCWNW